MKKTENAPKNQKTCPFSDRICDSTCAFYRNDKIVNPEKFSHRCSPLHYLSVATAMLALLRQDMDSLRFLEELENITLT